MFFRFQHQRYLLQMVSLALKCCLELDSMFVLHSNFAFPATLSTDGNFDFPFRDRSLFSGRGGGALYLGEGSLIFELHFGKGL